MDRRPGLAVAVLLLSCACVAPDQLPRVAPEVRVLPPGVAVEQGPGPGTLTIALDTAGRAAIAEVKPGDVLVSSVGRGFARRVLSPPRIVPDAGRHVAVLDVAPAGLAEVFERADLTLSLGELATDAGAARADTFPLPGLHVDLGGTRIRLGKDGGSELDVEIARGRFDFDPSVSLDVSIGGAQPGVSAMTEGTIEAALDVHVQARAGAYAPLEEWLREIPIIEQEVPRVLWIGAVPVVVTSEISLGVGVELEVRGDASIRLGGEVTATLRAGAAHADGQWTNLSDLDLAADLRPIAISGSGRIESVRVYPIAKINLLLYDAAGPAISVEPYAWWRRGEHAQRTGVRGRFRAEMRVPIIDEPLAVYRATLFDCFRDSDGAAGCAAGDAP